MPAEVVKTVRASGGDYTSLSAWEAGEQRDLVAADEIAVAECYGDWAGGLTDDVSISGWTCDSTRFITIRAAPGHEHNGVRLGDGGSGFAITSTNSLGTIRAIVFKLVLQDIEIINTTQKTISYFSSAPAGAYIDIDRCIVELTSANSAYYAAELRATGKNVSIRNTLFITKNGARAADVRDNNTAIIENCGAYVGGYLGIAGGVIKNTWVIGATNFDFYQPVSGGTNNFSSDTSAPGANPSTGLTTSAFTDAANDDYSPVSGSLLIDAGVDLSGYFTDDIAGNTRDANFDIGPFEYAAAGSAPIMASTLRAA